MSWLQTTDPFEIMPGSTSIMIGAPHHGSRPGVDADWGTGPIAMALARTMAGGGLVVNDLRRIADVNKDPSMLANGARKLALRYQNLLFSGWPRLLVEIHGHNSGRYDIEISTGFELDPHFTAEAKYLDKLAVLRKLLPDAIQSRLGQRPSVGIWPLDRNVEKTATNTFTFRKVRRARHLAGLEWYGLHIELNAALRVSRGTSTGNISALPPEGVQALSEALAASIHASFDPLPQIEARIPTRVEAGNGSYAVMAEQILTVARAPEGYTNENTLLLHPDTMKLIGALPGDLLLVHNGSDELRSQAISSQLVRPRQIAMSQRMRRQIGAEPNHNISVARLSRQRNRPDSSAIETSELATAVVYQILPAQKPQLWLNGSTCLQLGLTPETMINLTGLNGHAPVRARLMSVDENLPNLGIALSNPLATQIGISIGETIKLVQG